MHIKIGAFEMPFEDKFGGKKFLENTCVVAILKLFLDAKYTTSL